MDSAGSPSPTADWLVENGPKELELLFRAIVFHPSAPILIADNDGNSRKPVSARASSWVSRGKKSSAAVWMILRMPSFKPVISERWRAFLEEGEQEGTLQLVGPDGGPRDVEYTAKGNVLPVRHLLVLRDKTALRQARSPRQDSRSVFRPGCRTMRSSCWMWTDRWSPGMRERSASTATRADEVVGQHVSLLYPGEDALGQAARKN